MQEIFFSHKTPPLRCITSGGILLLFGKSMQNEPKGNPSDWVSLWKPFLNGQEGACGPPPWISPGECPHFVFMIIKCFRRTNTGTKTRRGVGALSKQPDGLFVASDRKSYAPRREASFFPYSFCKHKKNMAVGDI